MNNEDKNLDLTVTEEGGEFTTMKQEGGGKVGCVGCVGCVGGGVSCTNTGK